ncbi:hypothetical protein [Devosia ginsengisoli]|uniref:hypothetical protein n=1 Tax=Devosia ginsengisoli TaxID=400770 RepID=UPI0026E9538E|nr:hypothetical protein [Devosia ginsengisoli]MCR6671997.1 hypothetical protein [Devosia ginsengisoli]
MTVNYSDAAELFPGKNTKKSSQIGYRRFSSVAEAVRFAVEDMPAILLRGAFLQVDERRFDGSQIRSLYNAENFPLTRAA